MSNRIPFLAAVAAVLIILCGFAAGQTSGQDAQQKAMEMYAKLGAVGPHHDWFKPLAGEWQVRATMWVLPGAEPSSAENRASAELFLGGRFMKMTYKGLMLGQPFEGFQLSGYDNYRQKYVTLWIDSTSTAFYLTTGTLDASGRVMTETGVQPDPMTGGEIKVRNVMRLIGPDEFLYESYMTLPNGQEFRTLEQRGVRRK